MNTNETNMEHGRSGKRGLAAVGAAVLLTACTHTQPEFVKLSSEPRTQSRALTTEQDQRTEGLPVKPFDLRALLGGEEARQEPRSTRKDVQVGQGSRRAAAASIFQGGDKNEGTQPALSSRLERAGSISRKTPGQETSVAMAYDEHVH